MEHVRKDYYSTFYKHLHVCDHYDMKFEPKMFTKELHMLMYARVSLEQKLAWLKQWNEPNVL